MDDNSVDGNTVDTSGVNDDSSVATGRPRVMSAHSSGSLGCMLGHEFGGRPSQQMTLLPEDFNPGDDDVICGRGKKCYNHIGNERFRKRVIGMLDEYSRAKSKLDKSGVLASVVDQIRAISPAGGFVKQNENGRWYEVGDFLAREKTSQAFRDALHERYKSSNVAKKKRRQEEQAKATDKFHRIGIARAHSDTSALEWMALSHDMNGLNMSSPHHPHHANGGHDIFQGTNFDVMARLNRLRANGGAMGTNSDAVTAHIMGLRSLGLARSHSGLSPAQEAQQSALVRMGGLQQQQQMQRRYMLPARSLSSNSAVRGSLHPGMSPMAGSGGPPLMPQRPGSALGSSINSNNSGSGSGNHHNELLYGNMGHTSASNLNSSLSNLNNNSFSNHNSSLSNLGAGGGYGGGGSALRMGSPTDEYGNSSFSSRHAMMEAGCPPIRQPVRSDRARSGRRPMNNHMGGGSGGGEFGMEGNDCNDYPAAFRDMMDSPYHMDSYHRPTRLAELSEDREVVQQQLCSQQQQQLLHRSMPNISSDWDNNFDDLYGGGGGGGGSSGDGGRSRNLAALHHSTPNINFSTDDLMLQGGEGDCGGPGSPEDSFNGDLLDPIPLDEITPRPAAKKSVSDAFKKPLPMTLSPTSPSVGVVSKDLIACLQKMTGSSIKDNNPFEPLPLCADDSEADPGNDDDEPLPIGVGIEDDDEIIPRRPRQQQHHHELEQQRQYQQQQQRRNNDDYHYLSDFKLPAAETL